MTTKKKTEAMTTTSPHTALEERPEWIKEGSRGTEGITRDDVKLPRIALAQALSDQLDPENPTYIDGLKKGDFFNSLTEEVYGPGPITFCVVRRDPARYVEFNPLDQGGGVKDLNVPPDDPRTEWRTDPTTGERLKPIAMKFYDFVVVLLPSREVVGLSFKSTGLNAAMALNMFIMKRNADVFAGLYTLSSATERNSKGTYSVPRVTNAGWVADQEVYAFVEQTYEAFRDKEVEIDRGHVAADEAPSPAPTEEAPF